MQRQKSNGQLEQRHWESLHFFPHMQHCAALKLFLCLCVCAYVCARVLHEESRGWSWMCFCLSLYFLRQCVSLNLQLTLPRLARYLPQSICLSPWLPHLSHAGVTVYAATPALNVGVGDQLSGPHAYEGTALPTEPVLPPYDLQKGLIFVTHAHYAPPPQLRFEYACTNHLSSTHVPPCSYIDFSLQYIAEPLCFIYFLFIYLFIL